MILASDFLRPEVFASHAYRKCFPEPAIRKSPWWLFFYSYGKFCGLFLRLSYFRSTSCRDLFRLVPLFFSLFHFLFGRLLYYRRSLSLFVFCFSKITGFARFSTRLDRIFPNRKPKIDGKSCLPFRQVPVFRLFRSFDRTEMCSKIISSSIYAHFFAVSLINALSSSAVLFESIHCHLCTYTMTALNFGLSLITIPLFYLRFFQGPHSNLLITFFYNFLSFKDHFMILIFSTAIF